MHKIINSTNNIKGLHTIKKARTKKKARKEGKITGKYMGKGNTTKILHTLCGMQYFLKIGLTLWA